MQMTMDKLKAMSPERRATLYENARKRLEQGGQEIIDLINASGLPLRSGGITFSDPVHLRMEEIAWSSQGKRLMLEATEAGLPALAGVEPLIVADLGPLYHPHDLGTVDAGSIVGQVMRHLGYELVDRNDMPPGSVAKTAATWRPRVR
ncbi:hypothetical protein EN925_00885 [Mesorhizobium sp. M7A.F.Ca.US.006.04.2.1]|uniref:hypothetical protein n=1 Tax=unclassified Mesorhizobium TaxID=325217 RepID=UPI000FCA4442|nr:MULTISPECIES: hypothetical protein [unclassified Mesorhizobium]RUX73383.1 hypothetical protein EN990_21625 [Mesorhizobium sp. M7A.F.Ca.US.005.03.1.1]RUY19358.1 hypothetical protein EN991_00595 [Mesorhizobium sp. M7A.F.Ca.US.005.03.2.1]RVA96645.1 hypothetical protein EN925_00885 [Mesorhizobium sp. M7A.F.Ca.US.006.04.2.1]